MPKAGTIDDSTTWKLIHHQRAALADTLETLSPAQWARPSLCRGWSVQVAAAHVMAGAEQTGPTFVRDMAAHGFRFNAMIDRVAQRSGTLSPEEIIGRLRARATTTNHPPAPIMTMLGEVVVHGADICRPLGVATDVAPEAAAACLTMYTAVSFPVGTKKRIAGLHLQATDVDWSHRSGAVVSGPSQGLLLAMTGRARGLDDLEGDGVQELRTRMGVA
jgi:uncharacterized protein (TIGR03083 family)